MAASSRFAFCTTLVVCSLFAAPICLAEPAAEPGADRNSLGEPQLKPARQTGLAAEGPGRSDREISLRRPNRARSWQSRVRFKLKTDFDRRTASDRPQVPKFDFERIGQRDRNEDTFEPMVSVAPAAEHPQTEI